MSIERLRGSRRETEFYVLLLLAALGPIALAGANDLLLLVAAYLLASVPLYALAGIAQDAPGTEAAMKYYLLGALSGVTMLAGVTLLFGVGAFHALHRTWPAALPGAARAAVAVGLVAGAGRAAVQGRRRAAALLGARRRPGRRPPRSRAFVTTIPKIGGLLALYRLLLHGPADADVDWALLVAVLAAATMTLGNLAAFFQDDVRRLLAYSTISQVGYLLLAVAAAGRSAARPAGARCLPRRLRRHQPRRLRRRRRASAGPRARRLPRRWHAGTPCSR